MRYRGHWTPRVGVARRPTWRCVGWAGDVTHMQQLDVGDGHDLVLDQGCFHGLSDHGRALCATGITSVAAPGALLLMMAFQPGSRPDCPRGVSEKSSV